MNNNRLKVLLTVHQFFPRHIHGTERYTLDLAKALQSLGHEVVVLTRSHHEEDCDDRDWNEYVYDGVRVLAVDMVTHAHHGFDGSFERHDLDGIYADIVCQERADIIHCCHLLYLGSNFVSVAERAGVPIFMTFTDFFGICWTNRLQKFHGGVCRGPDPDELNCIQDVLRTVDRPFGRSLLDLLYQGVVRTRLGVRCLQLAVNKGWVRSEAILQPLRGMEKRRGCITGHYRRASQYIAATSYLRNAYIRGGYPEEKMKLMHFGIEQPTASERMALRERYVTLTTTGRPFVIGFVGQIAKHKGLLDLIMAFDRIGAENTVLHLYGDIKQDPKFSKLMGDLISGNPLVSLLGTFPGGEIYSKLAGIDVLVIPSTWAENSPLILLNALASRTMVVVTEVEGMADLVQHDLNGRLVPPCDPVSLAKTLRALMLERNHLLEWYNGNFASYATAPSDYAIELANLYRTKCAEFASAPRYRRENFPLRSLRPIVVSCSRVKEHDGDLAMECTEVAPWRLLPHLMAMEQNGKSTVLRADAAGAHLNLERSVDAKPEGEGIFLVKWPRPGVSAVYYTTVKDPAFSERQKIVKMVPGGVWCRFSLQFPPGADKVVRIRWDPLHDAVGLPIEIGCPQMTASGLSPCEDARVIDGGRE